MAIQVTQAEKERLLAELHALKRFQSQLLRDTAAKVAKKSERKILRRLNKVSMTIREVPIQEVLSLERAGPPTIAGIRRLKQDL